MREQPYRNDTLTIVDDLTWNIDQSMIGKRVSIYADVSVRDWRWLWLRRKTTTVTLKTIKL